MRNGGTKAPPYNRNGNDTGWCDPQRIINNHACRWQAYLYKSRKGSDDTLKAWCEVTPAARRIRREIFFQMKQRELQTYFVYFKVPAAHSWEKRSAK